MQREFTYAEFAGDARAFATEYATFAEATGWTVRIAEERLTLAGTTLRFALVDHRGVDFPVPLDVSVRPDERAALELPYVLACLQAAAMMGEAMEEVSEAEFAEAEARTGREPGRGRSLRDTLLDCRKVVSAAMAADYREFMNLGIGPLVAAAIVGDLGSGGP